MQTDVIRWTDVIGCTDGRVDTLETISREDVEVIGGGVVCRMRVVWVLKDSGCGW